jgi:protein disulfide-isomerase
MKSLPKVQIKPAKTVQTIFLWSCMAVLLSSSFPKLAASESAPGKLEIEPKARLEALWVTDFVLAIEKAKAEKKALLLNFTGSDWCGWCHRIEREIFAHHHFLDFAEENLVLVYLDFPRRKSLPAHLQKQNRELGDFFGVTGYPTLILLSPDGEPLGRLGYMQGGPKTFVRAVRKLQR